MFKFFGEILCGNIIFYAVLLIGLNFISFTAYGIDKYRAKNNGWRISEDTLLILTFIFGGPGAFLGMKVFRHKTKHIKFKILVPLFLILQILFISASCISWIMQ